MHRHPPYFAHVNATIPSPGRGRCTPAGRRQHDRRIAAPSAVCAGNGQTMLIASTNAPLHLPQPLAPLIGRRPLVEEIADLIREPGVQLVTLTGPGGVGKTRLAIRV